MIAFLYFQLVFLIVAVFYNFMKYRKCKSKYWLACATLAFLSSASTVLTLFQLKCSLLTQSKIFSAIAIVTFVFICMTFAWLISNAMRTYKND